MQTYQDYVDEIQSAVHSSDTADPDFLRDTAAMYAEACAEVNDRLRRVGHLLRRGHRSEALQLTEEEPNLLDQVALLDFPERLEWINMLIDWGMVAPPQLLVDIAADLNRAYADQQPVEPLLRQHRLLALGRAPLDARISVLRQLIQLDNNNDAWETDLEAMEKARLKQIGGEAEAAFRRQDFATLDRLYKEVESGDWRVSLTQSVRTRVTNLYNQSAVNTATTDLAQLAASLNEAFMAFDIDAGMAARDKWQDRMEVAKLPAGDPLLEQAMPALAWLSDQDQLSESHRRREEAIRKLERSLEEELPAKELELLLDKAMAFDEPLPELLNTRVTRRLEGAAVTARRRHSATMLSLVGVLILTAGGIGYLVFAQRQARAIEDAAGTMKRLVDEEKIPQATKFYASLSQDQPQVANSELVQAQQARVLDAQQKAKERLAEFDRAFAEAAAQPDSLDESLFDKARGLAESDNQRREVDKIHAEYLTKRRELQRGRDDKFTGVLESLRTRLGDLQRAKGEPAELIKAADSLSRDIRDAEKSHNMASRALLSQLKPLAARTQALEQGWRQVIKSEQASEALTAAVGSPPAFTSALKGYARAVPDSPLAVNLEKLESESRLWSGLQAWSAFIATDLGDPRRMNARSAAAALERGDKLVASHGELPIARAFEDRRAYLASLTQREEATRKLLDLFRDPIVADLWVVRQTDRDSYYCPKEPKEQESQWRFEYYTDFDLAKKPTSTLKSNVEFVGPAPQSELAKEGIKAIGRLRTRSWEATCCGLLKQIQDEERLDPILRFVLLKQVMRQSLRGSSTMEEGFSSFSDSLNSINVDVTVKWMDPRDKDAAAERDRAARLLRRLPLLDESITATSRAHQKLQTLGGPEFGWVGWLSRDRSGAWTVVTSGKAFADGTLVVATLTGAGDKPELITIGTAREQKVNLTSSMPAALVEGRPVFVQHSRGIN